MPSSAFVWTSEAEDMVIDKVRNIPTLWNPELPSYSKKLLKKHLYSEIASAVSDVIPDMHGLTGEAVMVKFNILRSSFRRELAKAKALKIGSGVDYQTKWKFFEALMFLNDVLPPGGMTNLDLTAMSGQNADITTQSEEDPLQLERTELQPVMKKMKKMHNQSPSYIDKALAVPNKSCDNGQIFGDYVEATAQPEVDPLQLERTEMQPNMKKKKMHNQSPAYIDKALAVLNQSRDSEQIFGDYVASEIRELQNPINKRKLKRIITEAIMNIAEADVASVAIQSVLSHSSSLAASSYSEDTKPYIFPDH